MSNIETFVLVELNIADATIEPCALHGCQIKVGDTPSIKRIIRTFESRERANQDLELLQEAMPAARFDVQSIEFIDR